MDKIRILCENNMAYSEFDAGVELIEVARRLSDVCKYPILAAYVDNELKSLRDKLYTSHKVRFIDYTDPDGRRTYIRSLCFVLQRVISQLYPDYSLIIDYSLPNGLYAELRDRENEADGSPKEIHLSKDELRILKEKMQALIDRDLPFTKEKVPYKLAQQLFNMNGRPEKAALVETLGEFFTSVYFMDGYADTFYGPLLYSTGAITRFNIIPYSEGFCLQTPSRFNPAKIEECRYQDKLSKVFEEYSDWRSIVGVNGMSDLNKAIDRKEVAGIIQLAEALHERKYAAIADEIYKRKDSVRLVLISGPSSSGKTTTSKRIDIQCRVLGLNPKVIGMDDYFVERERTPRDENGDFDFEAVEALDLPFLTAQLNDLFNGKEVELPKFDFIQGKRVFNGRKMKLEENDIIIMEGIHALNPTLTKDLDPKRLFKVYISALTSISLDENNNISTTDSRLIRRMLRDYRTRGISPEETILRWASVRRGEDRNIFPYQENADMAFNSTLLYELSALRYYVEPLLNTIKPLSPAYSESIRLKKFLSYVTPMVPEDFVHIPPTSVLREFIGGSSFEY